METVSNVKTFVCPLLVLNLLFNNYMLKDPCRIRLVTEVFAKEVIYRECCGFERTFLLSGVFYLTLLTAFSRLSWGQQFNLKVSRVSCWSSKHSPRLSLCITAIHKRFICGRFYLRARAGQSRNINLYGELILRNISFEIFASYRMWTLFAIGEHVTSLLS